MREITVIGGGIAGLVASIEAAEAGASVRVVEARSSLGGRARTSDGEFRANLGPHALYSDGPAWAWLRGRDLLPPVVRPPAGGFRVRVDGALRRTPPLSVVGPLLRARRRVAPVDVDFRSWASAQWGDEVAARLCAAAGVFAFDHDPGRLSAAFVWPRLVRVSALPPAARYPVGGWTALVDRLVDRARSLGVTIVVGERVKSLPGGPVVVATELREAAALLGDDSIAWEGGRCVCLDVGLSRRRGDAFIVSDFDEGGWVERFSASDSTLAPDGASLVQAQIGIRPGESADDAAARLSTLMDLGLPGWESRELWRRRQVMDARSGALDLPGTTWRDRPAIDRGDGVFLAGDMVAADGLLSEVSFASAAEAARSALRQLSVNRPRSAPVPG